MPRGSTDSQASTEPMPFQTTEERFLCHIIVSISHTIADGTTMISIARQLLDCLDDAISGHEINKSIQASRLLNPKYRQDITNKIQSEFISNPQLAQEAMHMYQSSSGRTLIEKVYPVYPNMPLQSDWFPFTVDATTTRKFIEKCKEAEISFHSGYFAIVNAATVKLLLQKEVTQKYYNISGVHAIDCRQYCGMGSDEHGVNYGVLDVPIKTPLDVTENFWKYAIEYNKILKNQINSRACFKYEVAEEMTRVKMVNLIETKRPHDKMFYYAASNMRDVTLLLENSRKNIQLKYISRTTNMHLFPVLWYHSCHTFKGCLMDTISYNSGLVNREVIEDLSDIILAYMTSAAT